jgi:hypothetical protein
MHLFRNNAILELRAAAERLADSAARMSDQRCYVVFDKITGRNHLVLHEQLDWMYGDDIARGDCQIVYRTEPRARADMPIKPYCRACKTHDHFIQNCPKIGDLLFTPIGELMEEFAA